MSQEREKTGKTCLRRGKAMGRHALGGGKVSKDMPEEGEYSEDMY